MGDETEQSGAAGPADGSPAPEPRPATDPASEADANADPAPRDPGAAPAADHAPLRYLRPWEALEQLDQQWDRPDQILNANSLISLDLTVPEDPYGFDYLGALGGYSASTVATTLALWLDAQLAADALALGRLYRPLVGLAPYGRRWYVVRAVGSLIWTIDGPGWPTPLAAVSAARRRYRAALLAEIAAGSDEPEGDPAQPLPAAGPDRAPIDATKEVP
jgi:hypothetical protein